MTNTDARDGRKRGVVRFTGAEKAKRWRIKNPERVIWSAMIRRCDSTDRQKKYYSELGVKVCSRWRRSFKAFLADLGPRPSAKHSLDRYPDNDGNYKPGNCRWATKQEQADNQRNTILISGKPLSFWADQIGLKHATIRDRLQRKGWSPERAIQPI